MKNIIKKILIESEDEWDWVREIDPAIILEPDTLYYFVPSLTPEESLTFSRRIVNSKRFKEFFYHRFYYEDKVNYFATGSSLEELGGWCSSTTVGIARSVYYGHLKQVDARKTFNI